MAKHGMNRVIEFFEGPPNGELSMSRLLVFAAFIVAAPLTWKIATTEALATFLGAFVINYTAGKTADVFMSKKNVDNPDA